MSDVVKEAAKAVGEAQCKADPRKYIGSGEDAVLPDQEELLEIGYEEGFGV